MMKTADEIVKQLRNEQIAALRKVAEAGADGHDLGFNASVRDPNPFNLLIIHRSFPGLLTGFSKKDDPSARRVAITDLGRDVLTAAQAASLNG